MPGNGLFKQWGSFGYCPPIAYKYEHESNKIKNYFFFFIRKVGMEGFKFKSVVSLGWSKGIHH
jgi:hypothetical protein